MWHVSSPSCHAALLESVTKWMLFSCFQAVAELRKSGLEMNFSFLNYAQSSECRNWQDSSVSYAAGALIVHWGRLLQGPLLRRHPAVTIYRHNMTQTPPSHIAPPVTPTICRKDLDAQSQQSSSFYVSLSLTCPLLLSTLLLVWSVSQSFWLKHFVWSAVLRLCRSKQLEETGGTNSY